MISKANAPLTVLDILNRTKTFFEKKEVPDARLDAEYIISHGLNMKNRMDLYLNFEKPLTNQELDTLRQLVARRANREPLQHIIGNTSFRGHIIKCDPRALIPRPETEDIVDLVKKSVQQQEFPLIVEIGTGTGAIAISCAKEIEGARVIATDISKEALSLAKENATANSVQHPKLSFAEGNLLEAVTSEILVAAGTVSDAKIDSLVANLPYIPDGKKGTLQPEVDQFDPPLALYGGPDGLDLVRKLLSQTEGRMVSGASIFLEIGSEQAEILKAEASNYPWLSFEQSHKDYCDNIRFVEYKVK
ncbi:MAG: peptide chain release factor N(5)-glutamine methyltransferase [Fibrobacter sp.]|nr:peptide chain release factor N(5)-glutamine methyltransferase [Fibrobacter sp.]